MLLTAYIASASDGFFMVKTIEIPELAVRTGKIEQIPEAVRAAAAITGKGPAGLRPNYGLLTPNAMDKAFESSGFLRLP
ncbi:hypothetical protein J7I84_00900 [Arthrobacter sp. ISL-85]|uniref:hypothetical protein n=1 Tax=Arthrobacter sp. ISL-85 TaxID=2819115 RepID=UPI001BEA1CCF|nr:hypothetical protein [Arthrobacter sp. ISL-85]MBT2565068.1 hypothetical protein [Arthrobacter sp. ISL-85]